MERRPHEIREHPVNPNSHWSERDLAVVWHPCTQMKDHERLPLIPIRSGDGVWLEDYEGRRYLDAISSWWVNLFGHRNRRISAAIQRQLGQLEHVLLAGFTHAPVIELSEHLRRVAPPGLTRCFYADNGSSAVEVSLKLSFHAWRNRGATQRTKFITLTNSYHGETLGALAVVHDLLEVVADRAAVLAVELLREPLRRGEDLRLAAGDLGRPAHLLRPHDVRDDREAELRGLCALGLPLLRGHQRLLQRLVQLAVESKADHLISHNIRHLEPARKLGVNLLEPRDFLAILRT
jgi:hypothetical protein